MKFQQLINRLPKKVVDGLKSTMQDPKYHKEGDVYTHTQMVFNEVTKHDGSKDHLIAAIFHDLGKIDVTTQWVDKSGTVRISSINHENKSVEYFDKYHKLYSDLIEDVELVRMIIKNHMRTHLYVNGTLKNPNKRQAFETDKYFQDYLFFGECDDNGRIK